MLFTLKHHSKWPAPLQSRNCNSLTTLQANGFLLCMCSPVLHKILCRSFIESNGKKLRLNYVDGRAFSWVLNMWCGKKHCCREMELDEIRELASAADRLRMTEVVSALDETAK